MRRWGVGAAGRAQLLPPRVQVRLRHLRQPAVGTLLLRGGALQRAQAPTCQATQPARAQPTQVLLHCQLLSPQLLPVVASRLVSRMVAAWPSRQPRCFLVCCRVPQRVEQGLHACPLALEFCYPRVPLAGLLTHAEQSPGQPSDRAAAAAAGGLWRPRQPLTAALLRLRAA